ncbi:B12-binding domain-containing radical SAM protein [Candidatus Sumerlaeota bacterium]|nr:B12-binding domain-containing radical SAM protein [Candidatus Sumerlaeota bacterium]
MNRSLRRSRFRVVVPAYPAFNIYSRIARLTTALGPVCIGTVVSRMEGWDVEVIDENNYRKFGPKDSEGRPDHATLQLIRPADVVGLYGGLSSTIPRLYDLARFYREHGVITIAGGQHFVGENVRDALDNGIDYLVMDEGEETIQELLAVIRENREPDAVSGVAFMRNGQVVRTPDRPPIADFDGMPLPDFDLVRYAKIAVYPINWVRGCGMDCEFCTVKGRPRPASVHRIVEQIAALVETRKARQFFIVDDLFGQRRKESLELCRLLTEYQAAIGLKLDFTVQIRLDRASDAELLQAMRKAGVTMVCIGFESPIPEELEAMNKKVKPEEMLALTRLYHKAGFLVHGMFIFGYPLPEGVRLNLSVGQRVRHFRSFIRKSRLDTIQVLLPVPLPGTALTERLAAQNRIFSRDIVGWEFYDGNFPLLEPDDPLTPEEMHLALRKIMGRFYRFRFFFVIGLNILLFPAMIFSVFNLGRGWGRWYRSWRNALKRFGGWLVMRRWTAALKRSAFAERIVRARDGLRKARLASSRSATPDEKP